MRVAFRADASVEIGTGHVMRCLTLADALRGNGAECLFLCRPHDGHLLELIGARGHEAIALPRRAGGAGDAGPGLPAHAHWLGTDWATDAEDSRAALAGGPVDWLVADHYALDRSWEQAMRPHCRRLLAIDDLADRPHDCDLLLDQNLGRRAEDYRGLLPPAAQTLVGPHYALLRPEFAALRPESLARREHPEFRHLLITMGGVDKDNATGVVLDALAGCDLPPDLRITVVLGPHAPFLDQVRAQAETMPRPTRVLAGVGDMARLMTDADLAIGAAGSTSWERCCLGLPTIQMVLAENQRAIAQAMARDGAAILLDDLALPGWPMLLATAIDRLHSTDELVWFSTRTAAICDGKGATCVRRAIDASRFTIRHADLSDARRIWEWRYDGDVARYYKSAGVPAYSDHQKWFAGALADAGKMLLIACRDGEPVAHVRFDKQRDQPAVAMVSIYVSSAARGQGIAGPILRLALDLGARSDMRRFLAQVHRENRASAMLFERCGFVHVGSDEPFLDYSLDMPISREK